MERLTLPSGLPGPEGVALTIAASLWRPKRTPRRLWVCQPGGNMNRHYFDLRPPGSDDLSYSFAAQMTARGDAVLALDHLGVGDSERPFDGWQLTPERLAAATISALRAAKPQLPDVPMIGLGHSMGAMMTVLVQAAAQPFAAIALLGFSTRGLPAFLPPALKGISAPLPDGEALRPHAEAMFGQPFPVIHQRRSGNRELFGSAAAEAPGIASLKRATDCLLPIPALRSMLPGNVAVEAAQINVPLFLGVGDQDMTGPPDAIAHAFGHAPSVTLKVLPDTGHSHFLFASRAQLFDAMADWAQNLASTA
jgi:pimeloyl-ACP methyl ester carboxylesterase